MTEPAPNTRPRLRPLRTLATVGALTAALPITLPVLAGCLAARRLAGPRRRARPEGGARTVLISGAKMTKALQLARSFHAAGHRVVLIESHDYWLTGHRYSRAVSAFHTTPKPGAPGYVEALVAIIQAERVDVYVPVCSPAASLHDAAAHPELSRYCEVIHAGPDTIDALDDKHAFAAAAERFGLRVPKTIRVESPEDVLAHDFSGETHPFILKSLAYDAVRRLDLTQLPRPTHDETEAYVRSLPIRADNPWVLQEFIAGTEYCTHGTYRAGACRVHACCASSAFQINYEHIDKPAITDWVTRFGAGLGLTGQASFDFIESAADGQVYAIECNPRTHSAITMFYDHPELAAAYLGGDLSNAPIEPTRASQPTYWIAHELWRLLAAVRRREGLGQRLAVIATGTDAVFDWRDPWPFFMLHHTQIPLLLLRSVRDDRPWLTIDFNIGKLVQPGGD